MLGMERPCRRKKGRLQWRYMDIVKEEMQRVGGCDWGRYSAGPTRKGSSCKKTLFIYIMLQSQELKAHKAGRNWTCDYCSITYLKELKFCDEYCEKIIGLIIFLLSDPYEQVVLPVDGLKEEEPVEPYQKIGPSKTVWCT